jgi:hypothetical protein
LVARGAAGLAGLAAFFGAPLVGVFFAIAFFVGGFFATNFVGLASGGETSAASVFGATAQ